MSSTTQSNVPPSTPLAQQPTMQPTLPPESTEPMTDTTCLSGSVPIVFEMDETGHRIPDPKTRCRYTEETKEDVQRYKGSEAPETLAEMFARLSPSLSTQTATSPTLKMSLPSKANPLTSDRSPSPTPNEDGTYTCNICCQKVHVSSGGLKNFLQHQGSAGCLKLAGRAASKSKAKNKLQTQTIMSFFPKATPRQSNRSSATTSSPSVSMPSMAPLNLYALDVLAHIVKAAQDLPQDVPEAKESDLIASIVHRGGPDDPREAWEYLDPMLNQLLGYGVSVEEVSRHVRRGPLGVEGLCRYINGFVLEYGITGDLLEGKLRILLQAVELVKHSHRSGIPTTGQDSSTALHHHSPSTESILPILPTPHLSSSIRMQEDLDNEIECLGGAPNSIASSSLQRQLLNSQHQLLNSQHQLLNSRTTLEKDGVEIVDASDRTRCKQHILSVPPNQTAFGTYPFLLHVEEHTPWEFSSHRGTLVLRARRCEDRNLDSKGVCRPCRELSLLPRFRKISECIHDGMRDNTPYKYHGLASISDLAGKKERMIETFRLRHINEAKKLVGREGVIALHQQVLLAMSTGKTPRLDRILRVAFDRRMSLAAMLELLKKAANGLYHPKGFEEEEDLQTLLFLCLGGQRVAEIAHHIFGIPAPSTVRCRIMIPPLICSSSYPVESELVGNIKAVLGDLAGRLAGHTVIQVILMFDEIAQEKRPRWCDRTNKILGCCREHTKGRCMDFNSMADAQLVLEDMECGKVHLAHEATVGAIGVLCSDSKLYAARPFLISASCKQESAEEHASLLQTALDAMRSVRGFTRTRVVSIASDGESRRGKALVQLTFKHMLSPSSPIYSLLAGCALLDLHVRDDDLTADKDQKHVATKRPQNALLREKGVLVLGTWITPSILRSHLLKAGHLHAHVCALLNPNDKQDVQLAYNLLSDIWSLPELTSGSPGCIQARAALRIFGSLCYHVIMPYICVDMFIDDQLKHLSYAAHLALVLYVHEDARGDFLPTVLYLDIMIMIKNVYFCVAKAKIDNPHEPFHIILLGTDLREKLFGCLRMMVGNDANMDSHQLVQIISLLARGEHRSPSRLSLHLLPGLMADIALKTNIQTSVMFLCKVDSTPGALILAPFGTLLVHAPLTTDDIEDLAHDNSLHGLEMDTLRDSTTSLLTSNGMCALEDTAADVAWAPTDRAFSKAIPVDTDGTLINKARALSLLFKYSKTTSSADRLRRVQQQAHYSNCESDIQSFDASGQDSNHNLLIHNPVATLLTCEERLFLCIGEIVGLHVGSKAVDEVSLDLLLEETVQVTYQAYSLVCATANDDSTHKHDWQTHDLLPLKFKVPGVLVQPINPTISASAERAPFYLFETSILVALTSSLRDHMTKPYLKCIPHVVRTESYPYREASGKDSPNFRHIPANQITALSGLACFVAEALHELRDLSVLECPACTDPGVQLDTSNGQRILAHIGSHVLYDPSVDRSEEPCGLCLRPGALCSIYLTKRLGRNGQWSVKYGGTEPCPNSINFSYTVAVTSSPSSPCSNAPLVCSICPDEAPAVWRYNLWSHFLCRHPTVPSAKYAELWTLASDEMTAMVALWNSRKKQPKKRGKGKDYEPLKLSDAHTLRMLSSYITGVDDTAAEPAAGAERHDDMMEYASENRTSELQDSLQGLEHEGYELGGVEDGNREAGAIDKIDQGEMDVVVFGAGGDVDDTVESHKVSDGGSAIAESDAPRGNSRLTRFSAYLLTISSHYYTIDSPEPQSTRARPHAAEAEGFVLRDAATSSFGQKRKLQNMREVSVCLCGISAT
ncbi:hypothetical protein EVG20_g9459 [Dentipellis fragilis]|uniref:Uncharacterized protein n=1 Tax=Dentipellis fragilis TaxID=205917 RepID=A0A4Y9Y0Z6_9AGAM|nr:hypothetical protein EVG20_g9459 [Dentipellis fragilis]